MFTGADADGAVLDGISRAHSKADIHWYSHLKPFYYLILLVVQMSAAHKQKCFDSLHVFPGFPGEMFHPVIII